MARADLIVELVKYGMNGDKTKFKKISEAIIAEERQKNHSILADKIEFEIRAYSASHESSRFSPITRNSESSAESFITEIVPQKTFKDLILPNDVKDCCEKFIEEHMRADLLRSYGLEPRNKVLFIGAPGNGKTSLAEIIANELMVPLYVVKYDSIIGAYLGETASRLRKLIEYAKTQRCVLFFDEFETIGKERGDQHETGEIKRVVSSLLLQMDSIPSYVTIIAATNHPELLDKAAWRRFQMRLELPMPTRANIVNWLVDFENKHGIHLNYAYETLAKKLYGANFSEIEEFGLSVVRRYVLGLPNDNMRSIVNDELKRWSISNAKIDKEVESK